MSQRSAASELLRIEKWENPAWCDFRWRIDNCENETVWKAAYVVHSCLGFPLVLLGCYLIYKKIYKNLWSKGRGIWDFSEGALRPRATEAFILFSTIHVLGRSLYTTLLKAGAFPNNAWKEVNHDWPFVVLWISGVFFTVGLIYATPKSYVNTDRRRTTHGGEGVITRNRLPSRRTLNVLLVLYTVIPTVTLPLFALLDGTARDRGDFEIALVYNKIHYILWSTYCILLGVLSIYFGIKLLMILRSNVEAVSSVEGGVNREFKRAIIMLIVTLGCVFIMEIAYAGVLMSYGLLRVPILETFPAAVFIGFNWIFAAQLMIYPIFITAAYNQYKNKQDQKSRISSNVTGRSSGAGKSGSKRSHNGSELRVSVKNIASPSTGNSATMLLQGPPACVNYGYMNRTPQAHPGYNMNQHTLDGSPGVGNANAVHPWDWDMALRGNSTELKDMV